ncbi:MAG: ARMT1-like domain-containing protein, partial [Planctomycetota bacterium]
MNAWLDCVPCCIRQGLNTIRHISDDGDQHREVVHRIVTRLVGVTLEQTPAALSDVAYRVVEEVTGNPDPYLEEKRQSNAEALAIYDELARHVTTSDDPLKTALKLA